MARREVARVKIGRELLDMERIEQIINAADYMNVNRDLIAIKSYVLGDLASDLREEARDVIENSPNSFRLAFQLDGDIDIARLIQQIEDCIRTARESLYDLMTKTRTMLAQSQSVHSALRDARRRDVARAPEQFEFRVRDFAVPELIDRLHGRNVRRIVASPIDEEPELRPIDEEPESRPIDEEPESRPIDEEPESQPIGKEPESQPMEDEAEPSTVDEGEPPANVRLEGYEPELQPFFEE